MHCTPAVLFLVFHLALNACLADARWRHHHRRRWLAHHERNSTRHRLLEHNLELARTHAKDHSKNSKIQTKHIETHTFQQKLDHFNASSNATFSQRYFQYTRCFNNDSFRHDTYSYPPSFGGLMFVIVGGEWEAVKSELIIEDATGHKTMDDPIYLACREGFHALVLYLEHRYYGQSKIVEGGKNSSLERLRFLSVEQVIEDLAAFIRAKTAEFDVPFSRVVLFGCSYAGTVATYFRLTHPELCAGVVSFSGPLQPTFNFDGYHGVTRKSFGLVYPDCYRKVDKLLRSGVIAKTVAKYDKFSDIKEVEFASFLNASNSLYSTVKQNDSVNSLYQGVAESLFSMLTSMQYGDIDQKLNDSCSAMNESDIPSLAAMFNAYSDIEGAESEDDESSDDARQYFWTYQTCAQFGFFKSATSGQRDWFPPLKDGADVVPAESGAPTRCATDYGLSVTKVKDFVATTNRTYMAASRVGKLTNFLVVNGELDPWALLAKLPSPASGPEKRNIKWIVIPSGYHCPNMNINKRIARHGAKKLFENLVEQIRRWTV